MKGKIKEFRPTSWSIDNKISIYILVLVISVFGMMSYNSIPKEQFPDTFGRIKEHDKTQCQKRKNANLEKNCIEAMKNQARNKRNGSGFSP